jgi:methylenetetrahydrofolate--tRNA-(uracil-5-)-methyltransferase
MLSRELPTANLSTTLLSVAVVLGTHRDVEREGCRSRYHRGRANFHRMTKNFPRIRVLGAGLAGPEAALQAARRGCCVDLYEMRPARSTEAHQTADFAELVCSNSLKSESEYTAPWLLKQEMRRAGSVLLQAADASAVPAGHALAVDRVEFSRLVAEAIAAEPRITVRREEVTALDPADGWTVIASGPLTSPALSAAIAALTGSEHLAFYDSISPIVDAESIDMDRVYMAARWDKGTADYINCPMTAEEYDRFYDALVTAESVQEKEWEKLTYFEGCLPIEELARRGRDTPRFGPMKPVGLRDPRTGKTPWAVVQLRCENLRADSYNLVGFQNHLKFSEQARVLRLIPGLENAKFLRYGQIHRNTYINAPTLLTETLQLRDHLRILFAGQISGVEGYTESIATGMLAGLYAAELAHGQQPEPVPRATGLGSLVHYITHADPTRFQPANITFDLLEPLGEDVRRKVRDKRERHKMQCERSLAQFDVWWDRFRGASHASCGVGQPAVLGLFILAMLLSIATPRSFAWGRDGHKIINRVAMDSLPANTPAFLRTPKALDEIGYLGPEPDRWRSAAEPELSSSASPEHFIDLELADLVAPDGLPTERYDFLDDLNAANRLHPDLADRLTPQNVGMLPWQAEEDFERLTVDMADYRQLQRARADTYGAEQAVLYDIGCLGHYVGDGSQPLHTTVNYNGWVENENPERFSRQHGIHSRFETEFVHNNLQARDVAPLIPMARTLNAPFQDFLSYLRASHAQVIQVYRFDKQSAFDGHGTLASRTFTAERLAAGATMLRDMIYTAWLDSGELRTAPDGP